MDSAMEEEEKEVTDYRSVSLTRMMAAAWLFGVRLPYSFLVVSKSYLAYTLGTAPLILEK